MKKRDFLKAAAAIPFLPGLLSNRSLAATPRQTAAHLHSRVRPGDPAWPSPASWDRLGRNLDGRLLKLESPFSGCRSTPIASACSDALAHLDNPFYVGDQPALTQTSGWLDAWTSRPSAYAVAAKTASDVAAAVNFARSRNLRLVVKGGGHSYQGTSDAPDSLLVWTRRMNDVALHDAFVPRGCAGVVAAQPAVSLGAGAMWIDAYDAVTTQGGRYVQGGGCTTVGVAGLVQSGGFGSFSKRFGTAAAGLLEAEVVTADGQVRIANACSHPDLFWGLKGGGGGSLGVVTRVTLRTRELPDTFGAAFGTIRASSEDAYRRLIARTLAFYQDALFNPHWGEQIAFKRNAIKISMVFQGLTQQQARDTWAPFLEWVRADGAYSFEQPVDAVALPARRLWDAAFLKQFAPDAIVADDRAGALAQHMLWKGDQDQVGWFIHAYKSAWLPESLLQGDRQARLADALFAATRHWTVGLHFNKGLAGAPHEEREAARETATNPAVLDAFALAIIAGGDSPAFPGMPGQPADLAHARNEARDIGRAMDELRKAAPGAGSYVSESDYFQSGWQQAFWGSNHARLAAVKARYDPDGLFFVRHGVGSEGWSDDGFTRLSR